MRTIYFWMTFQILVGIWMFISPFVFRFREMMGPSTNNMIFGAVVVLLGFGVALYEFPTRRRLPTFLAWNMLKKEQAEMYPVLK